MSARTAGRGEGFSGTWVARAGIVGGVVALLLLYAITWWTDPSRWTAIDSLLGIASILALLWRRSFPLAVLAIVGAIGLVSLAVGTDGILVLPIAVACASVVATGRRWLGAAVAASFAVVTVIALLLRGDAWNSLTVLASTLALALGVAVGVAQDGRRRIIHAAVERAENAEALRDEEARRAVAEERLRIARDLHDVLAHQIAVIGVQTGAARYMLTDDPPAARVALDAARSASTGALRELTALLQLLRRSDDTVSTGHHPSLAHLDDLLAEVQRTGLQVETLIETPLPPLVPVTDVAAYRIVQEGLTNAHKHGDGRATLRVRADTGALTVTITNGIGAEPRPTSGRLGLTGMRERTDSVGGTLTATADDGVFTLECMFPLRADDGATPNREAER